jgi:hypothetical protein
MPYVFVTGSNIFKMMSDGLNFGFGSEIFSLNMVTLLANLTEVQ